MNTAHATTEANTMQRNTGKATDGFHRDKLHAFDPNTMVIKSTCQGCSFWMTANSFVDLTQKEAVHAKSCNKINRLQ